MSETPSTDVPAPPIAKKVPHKRTQHGDTFIDDYEWLRDKDSADTIAYLEAENAYTQAMTAHLGDLRQAIFTEVKSRTQETDMTVPSRTDDYWYYVRTEQGQQYPRMCRCPAQPHDWTPPHVEVGAQLPGEEVLLDCNALAEGVDFFSLGAFTVSTNAHLLAYSTDTVGDERFTIQIRDLRTGENLPDAIPNTLHDVVWSADDSHLFYTTVDDTWRPDRVWRHRLGTDPADDLCVYHEPDEKFWTSVGRTSSERYLLIASGSKITSEVLIAPADDPTDDFRVVIPRAEGVEYDVDHAVIGGQDRLVVLHNQDAVNFTLTQGPMTLSSLGETDTVIAPREDVRITDFVISATTLAVNLREAGLPQVRVFDLSDGEIGTGVRIDFDEPMFDAAADDFSDWHQPLVRLGYQSWLTPFTVIEYDPRTGERHVRKQQQVLGGYSPAAFVQTREWVTSRDGVQIPVSIIRHRDVPAHSNAPMMLFGYGSYEISMDPVMRTPALSLLERGMVWACAHIRGGGEMGRGWYDHGKKLEKKNTFNDFIDCARHLVDSGWTSPDRLVAHGGSAGGLLMGAIANAAPELFTGIVANVPFVDNLTSILDPSLPLTVIEWDEWGDPLHDPEVYAYMKSYSPYENVAARTYPAIYALTSLNDTRVLYVEPAKWVAKLRATASGDRPLLFKCEMTAGHGGVSGRYDAWRQLADYYAWAIDIAGAAHQPLHSIGGSDQSPEQSPSPT